MAKLRILITLTLAALIVFAGVVPATAQEGKEATNGNAVKTIYVDDDFTDEPANHKWDTIQEGIDDSSDGDTIIVYAGTYDGFTIENRNDLSINGQGGVTVSSANMFVDGGEWWVMAWVTNSTDIDIEGIVFDGEGIEENVVEGICYVNSTGSIIDVTMRNIVGTDGEGSMGMGIFVGGGEIGTVDISGVTTENVTNGIMVQNDEVHIKDCTIDGEAITDLGVGIFAMDNAKVTIEDSRIINWRGTGSWDSQEAQSIGIGIGFQRGYGPMATSTAEITGCTIENNIGGISVDSDGRATVNYNNIMGNEFGVGNLGEIPVDATNNWWGDASGPSGAGPGTGDAVSENVNYAPWLDSPVWDPMAYDTEPPYGEISKMEAIHAVMDYFSQKISKAQAIEVVMLCFG